MKKKQTDDVADFAGTSAPTVLGPADVQQKEFRVARFGGYKMREVDEFLDQITESMNKMVEENRKLRSQGGGSLIAAPDLTESARQADEIIQRAEAQAEQILRTAQTSASASASSGADRSPIDAFLAQERTFLQGLAGLVQGHADTVKGMVRADRAGAGAEKRTNVPTPPKAELAAPTTSADPRPTEPMQRDEPIRVEEPAAANAPASTHDDDTPGDGPDRSLRELFWGED